jgi:predicted metalloprotease
VRYDEGADLDTSGVEDLRGGGGFGGSGGGFGGFGGRGVAFGGGGLGLVGVVIYVLVQVLGGGSSGTGNTGSAGGFGALGSGQSTDNGSLAADCRTGADANSSVECAVVADIESIQNYWGQVLGSRYTETDTVFFSGSAQTGCGAASSGTGPFYCPADRLVYIDLSFFDQLRTQFGAEGGLFVDAYVLAHEYGHHVQDLLGTSQQVDTRLTGPSSGSVRLELQADCYAGTWANHAETVPDENGHTLIADITQDDVDRALDAAGRIGDDYIERTLGNGQVDPASFTHGTSAQRQKWFSTGYSTGDPAQCDTFSAGTLG